MFLILDTETTGLAQFQQPPDHPAQARICQLGCVLLDDQFVERASFCSLIKPDNWEISSGASAANGLTTQMCYDYGIPVARCLSILEGFYEQSEVAVAHNLKFDAFLVDIEYALLGNYNPFVWSQKGYCTMLKSTDVCKIAKKTGNGAFKWPKLQEAHQHFFGHAFDKAHDALADARACGRIFKQLLAVT